MYDSTVVFGLSRSFTVSLIALALLGVGDMVSVYIRGILVQLETPDAIRGRVSAVGSMFVGASNELGEFESGITAGWLGLVPAVVLGGAVTLAVVVSYWKLFPRLWGMDRYSGHHRSRDGGDPGASRGGGSCVGGLHAREIAL